MDYYKKFLGLSISAREADRFLQEHEYLKNTGIDWYITSFISATIDSWYNMKPEIRKKKEVKDCYDLECKILHKYHYGKSIILLLFAIHPLICYTFRFCVEVVKKLGKIL